MTRTKIFGNWRGFRRIPYNNDTAQCNVVYNNDTAQCNVVVLKRDDLALIFGDRFLYSHSVYAWNLELGTLFYVALHLAKSYFTGGPLINT